MDPEYVLQKLNNRKPGVLGEEDLLRFAVLLPLVVKDDEVHVLFEVRSSNLRRQPGEVCFPGGKLDKSDPDEMFCAIRETTEELGIRESDVSNVIPLDYMVSTFGTIIRPFAGIIGDISKIQPNPDEVGEIFTVPLSFLQQTEPDRFKVNFHVQPEDGFPFDLIVGGEDYNWHARQIDEYFYHYKGKVIWGLTARILSHFLELIKVNNI